MNTYPKFDVHYTFDKDETVYVDTVKARTLQEAADKIFKKYIDLPVKIQKIDLV